MTSNAATGAVRSAATGPPPPHTHTPPPPPSPTLPRLSPPPYPPTRAAAFWGGTGANRSEAPRGAGHGSGIRSCDGCQGASDSPAPAASFRSRPLRCHSAAAPRRRVAPGASAATGSLRPAHALWPGAAASPLLPARGPLSRRRTLPIAAAPQPRKAGSAFPILESGGAATTGQSLLYLRARPAGSGSCGSWPFEQIVDGRQRSECR